MEAQQLATKVTQLESRVATLEDENKIVKGEVKQILTEIRTAILVRDNPFENDAVAMRPTPLPPQAPAPVPEPHATSQPLPVQANEPVPLRPLPSAQAPAPVTMPVQIEQPQWSLLTIAGLAAWGEEAARRLGNLRMEILLDLCEAAGHLSPEARAALSRMTELDLPEPAGQASTNETVAMLRQLDALINDEDFGAPRAQRV